jgi:branched-chain amino acid transport system substrate-binding protein
MKRVVTLLVSWLFLLGHASYAAEAPLRIAVVNDQSGPFSDYGGIGSVIAAHLAAEDFGGEVLGRKIEILSADHQNKPDIASTIVRRMFDTEGVDVVVDGASSSASIAIQGISRERKKVFLITGATTVDLTGKECSPTSIHFAIDTFAIAQGAAQALAQAGNNTWFFVTADYAFGVSLERQARAVIEAGGGKVLGSVRHPFNTSDFSSYLLQAQTSRAKVVGFVNAGADFVNSVKQAHEFGLAPTQNLVGLFVDVIDIHALGLASAQGLSFVDPFYWDLSDETRSWTKRFSLGNSGKVPSQIHAGTYSAILHYLKAVKAAGSADGSVVSAKMKEMPINDMYHNGTRIRSDGRVLSDLFLVRVKSPAETHYAFDYLKVESRLTGEELYRPVKEGNCPFLTGEALSSK